MFNRLRPTRTSRVLVAVIAALAVASVSYGFTASNTVPTSVAGSGAAAVSGYTVSNVHYTLNSSTPANIDQATFTVSPTIPNTGSGKVYVQATLTSGGPYTFSCTTNTVGDTVTCATTAPSQLTAALVNGLTVIAAQ